MRVSQYKVARTGETTGGARVTEVVGCSPALPVQAHLCHSFSNQGPSVLLPPLLTQLPLTPEP